METVKTLSQVESAIQFLEVNEPYLSTARFVGKNNDKLSLEIVEKTKAGVNSGVNVLAVLNEGDERFSQGQAPRRAWITAEPEAVKKQFGIDVSQMQPEEQQTASGKSRMVFPIGIKNPTIQVGGKKIPLFVQVVEGINAQEVFGKGAEWALENLSQSVKQDGKGNYLTKNGMYIFSTTRIATEANDHTQIQHDGTTRILNTDVALTSDAKEEAAF